MQLTSPQLSLKESVARRRLYQGILLDTWWGTCTLMSCVKNSILQVHASQHITGCSQCLALPQLMAQK